jgi:hypothetical protein
VKRPTTNLNKGSRPLDWDTKRGSSEHQAGVLPALLDGRKKHGGGEKEELKISKRKEETKGREKGEKLRERKEASSSKQTSVTA